MTVGLTLLITFALGQLSPRERPDVTGRYEWRHPCDPRQPQRQSFAQVQHFETLKTYLHVRFQGMIRSQEAEFLGVCEGLMKLDMSCVYIGQANMSVIDILLL
jgi:hypothetical protein